MKPVLLAASALNLFSASSAYAGSGSSGVGVSVTVIRPDEKEITISETSSSSFLGREKTPSHADNIAPSAASRYNFDQDNYEWFDYQMPVKEAAVQKAAEQERKSHDDFYAGIEEELNKRHTYWWYVDDADLHLDHQVQKGDTVFKLCRIYAGHLTLENCLRELKKENPKLQNLDKIRVGEKLRIPSWD